MAFFCCALFRLCSWCITAVHEAQAEHVTHRHTITMITQLRWRYAPLQAEQQLERICHCSGNPNGSSKRPFLAHFTVYLSVRASSVASIAYMKDPGHETVHVRCTQSAPLVTAVCLTVHARLEYLPSGTISFSGQILRK